MMARWPKPFRGLSWKLTLSYTLVTVSALVVVQLIAAFGMWLLMSNPRIYQRTLISVAENYVVPQVATYLKGGQPDVLGLERWLQGLITSEGLRFQSPQYMGIEVTIGDTDENTALIVLSDNLDFIAGVPQPDKENLQLLVDGSADILAAAQAGVHDPERNSQINPDLGLVISLPVTDETGVLLGIIVLKTVYPPDISLLQVFLSVVQSILVYVLAAGLIGAVFGYFTARGLTRRLKGISTAADAWSHGDFSAFIQDRSSDELSQLAQQLNRMAEQLQHLLKTKQELATLEERNRLARDLHDSVKQQVFATTMQIGAAKAVLSQDGEKTREHLDQAEQLSRQAQSELGVLIRELRPVTLSSGGLVAGVEDFCRNWAQQNAVELDFSHSDIPEIEPEVEQALFRVTQEALSNISRHSGANKVIVKLYSNETGILLVIQDNGSGFDLSNMSEKGMGLISMQERMQAVGGTLQIDSTVGRGTQITATYSGSKGD